MFDGSDAQVSTVYSSNCPSLQLNSPTGRSSHFKRANAGIAVGLLATDQEYRVTRLTRLQLAHSSGKAYASSTASTKMACLLTMASTAETGRMSSSTRCERPRDGVTSDSRLLTWLPSLMIRGTFRGLSCSTVNRMYAREHNAEKQLLTAPATGPE